MDEHLRPAIFECRTDSVAEIRYDRAAEWDIEAHLSRNEFNQCHSEFSGHPKFQRPVRIPAVVQ